LGAVSGVEAKVDLDACATALERSADYRVLRRLKPRLFWEGELTPDVLQVVVLDTETTGLDSTKDKIIELAILRLAVDSVTGQPVGGVQVYDGLEDPGFAIPPEVVGITGITDEDVKGQHLDEKRIADLLEGVDVVIAHNAGFDRPFCEKRIAQFIALDWGCSFADMDWKAQGQSSAKLESLALAQGLFYDAHRAETDCHALLAVLTAPLISKKSSRLAHILDQVKKPAFRLAATQAPFDAKDTLKARGYRWNSDQKVWHTRLSDEIALQHECDWLKAHVYQQRSAVVQVEKMNAQTKYSTRAGEILYRQL
jgi:DNA polymerase-3 subunit epsilon